MKIALLHLDFTDGEKEHSIEKIKKGMKQAKEKGAHWVLTPEVSVPGYFFHEDKREAVLLSPSEWADFSRLAKMYHLQLFLSHVEERDGKYYNAVTYIDSHGERRESYFKHHSHQKGMEGWVTLGTTYPVWHVEGLRVVPLICSDTYYEDTVTMRAKDRADILIVPAAWPPAPCCRNPVAVWERCAQKCKIPMFVCNQTGHHDSMNLCDAPSVMIENGKAVDTYTGGEALLIGNISDDGEHILSPSWKIYPWKEGKR